MSTLFYRNRRLLVLAILGIVVAGLSAFSTLPRLEDPHLNNRVAIIVTRLPGATAERVEVLITEKIEDELRDINEIESIRSMSRQGISLVTVELKGRITQSGTIWPKIRDRLGDAQGKFPTGATKPVLDEQRGATADTFLVALAWDREGDTPLGLLRRQAEELKDRFYALPGTENVELHGEPEEEVTVKVDPLELAALGLTVQDVARALTSADSKVAAGALRGTRHEMLLEVAGQFDTLSRIGDVPLIEEDDGRMVRVADIAEVSKGWREPPRSLAIIEGRPAIAIGARMEPDRRVDRWAALAHATLDDFERELSPGLKLVRVFDQNVYTTDRLEALGQNLLIGGGAVVLVILVLMGWRSAFLVASALPLSVGMVLAGLLWLGIPLHQMSITGLIIALGLLIDNAIVIVDEINSRRAEGLPAVAAISRAVGHLFVPLLGSTLTTVLAFMPIVLLTGNIGEFIGPLGVSVILALLSSLFVSLTIVPALTGLFGASGNAIEDQQGSWWRSGLRLKFLSAMARRGFLLIARRPVLGLLAASALPVAGFLRAGELRDQFFPPADRDQFMIQLRLPSVASIEQTRNRVEEASRIIKEAEGVLTIDWFLGASAPTIYYNMMRNEDDTPGYAQALIRAESVERVQSLVPDLQRRLDAQMSDAQVVVRAFGQGPPVESPIEIRLYGPSLDVLRTLGEEVRLQLAEVPEVLHTRGTLDSGLPKLRIKADENEARLAGLSLVDLAEQLQADLEGALGGSILEETEELPVRVRFLDDRRADLGQISAINFVSQEAEDWVPLSAIGEIEPSPEYDRIPRRNARRCNTIQGFIEMDALPKEVLTRFQVLLDESDFTLPEGYQLEFGGEEEEQGEAIGSLFASIGVLAVLMVATIVLSFQSFRMAALLSVVAIFSVGLSILSIWVSGYPFGFMAVIGTAGLIGLALNDSIVVLAGLRSHPGASVGDPEGIAEVLLGCSRHVLSTTFTTVAGFFPLLIGGGFWPPLAVVISGGILGSTLVALVYIPAGFVLAMRLEVLTVRFNASLRGERSTHIPQYKAAEIL